MDIAVLRLIGKTLFLGVTNNNKSKSILTHTKNAIKTQRFANLTDFVPVIICETPKNGPPCTSSYCNNSYYILRAYKILQIR